MKFRNLRETSCSICGCSEVISEYVEISSGIDDSHRINTHVNGGRWEH